MRCIIYAICPPFGARLIAKLGRMLLAGQQELVGVEGAARGAGACQVEGVGAALHAAPQGGSPPFAVAAPADRLKHKPCDGCAWRRPIVAADSLAAVKLRSGSSLPKCQTIALLSPRQSSVQGLAAHRMVRPRRTAASTLSSTPSP